MTGIRHQFIPKTGWRWWLHFGANETALMYPRFKMDLSGISKAISALAFAFENVLAPALTSASKALAQLGEAARNARG